MIKSAVFACPCRLPLIARASARRQRFLSAGISAMSKQEKAAEIIREAVDAKVIHFCLSGGVVTRVIVAPVTPALRVPVLSFSTSGLFIIRKHSTQITQHSDDNQLPSDLSFGSGW